MFRALVASTTRDTHPKGARGLPCVWRGAIRAILLDVHPKEAHVHSINFLKGKECFGSIRERFRHFPRIHKPEIKEPDVCMHHYHLQSALQTRPAAVNPLSAEKLEARSPLLTTGPGSSESWPHSLWHCFTQKGIPPPLMNVGYWQKGGYMLTDEKLSNYANSKALPES